MPKRKRQEDDPARPSDPRRVQRVEERLHHGRQTLFRALKLAKAFERQKLSRRQKTAKKEKQPDATQARIAAEIDAIKVLDVASAASSYVHKTIIKEKALANHPDLPPYVQRVQPVKDQATANICARLYKSNPVKEVMPGIMNDIRATLGVSNEKTAPKGSQAQVSKPKLPRPEKDKEDKKMDDLDNVEDGLDAGSISSEALAAYDDLIGSASDSDASSLDLTKARATAPRFSPSTALSLSPSPSASDSDLDQEDRPASKSRSETHQNPPSASDSNNDEDSSSSTSDPPQPSNSTTQPSKAPNTFLPSLTLGGYISGSDDDDPLNSDEEEATRQQLALQPRKNRRGQRARQQIWEKKYGTGAKHLQSGPSSSSSSKQQRRDADWDPKYGARSASTPSSASGKQGYTPRWKAERAASRPQPPQSRQQAQRPPGGHRATGSNADGLGPRKPMQRGETQKLHPSWEAAKRRKAAAAAGQAGGSGAAAFKGTKISFD